MATFSADITDRILAGIAPQTGRIPALVLVEHSAIPAVVRGFALMELEIAFHADLEDLREHFALAPALESSLYQTFFLGLIGSATLAMSDARRILEQAIDDATRYLSEPQDFLLKLLGGQQSEIPLSDEYFHTFEYLQEYFYLRDILLAWSERQRATGVERVASSELRQLIRRIDQSVVGSYTIEQMQELLRALFDLFGGHSIPRELLQRFFFDKGATAVVRSLRDDSRSELSLTEMLDLLAVLMHQASSEVSESAAARHPERTEAPQTTSSAVTPEYQAFLTELREAGVHLAAPSEAQYLHELARRNPEEAAASKRGTHDN